MKKSIVLGFAIVALAASNFGLAGCAGQMPDSDPSAKSTAGQALTITEQDDHHVAGSFVSGNSVIVFASSVTPEGISTVDLTINGAKVTVTVDLFEHKAHEDGGGNTLLGDDLAALHSFEKYLDNHGEQGRPFERLFKMVAMYAAAPAGYTVIARDIGNRAQLRDGSGRESGTVTDERVTYLCKGLDSYTLGNNDDWVWAEHDSRPGEGSGNGTAGNAYHYRLQGFYAAGCQLNWNPGAAPPSYADQANNHNWLGAQVIGHTIGSNTWVGWTDGNSYNGTSTPNAQGGVPNTQGKWTGGGSCEGRCGAGCPRSYNFYFSKDCLDHDTCLDYHPAAGTTSSSGDCGYEYQDAQDDFFGGSSSEYQSTYCSNVLSTCPEAGNATAAGM